MGIFRSEKGQAIAEYGLILALIAIVFILALTAIGLAISGTLGDLTSVEPYELAVPEWLADHPWWSVLVAGIALVVLVSTLFVLAHPFGDSRSDGLILGAWVFLLVAIVCFSVGGTGVGMTWAEDGNSLVEAVGDKGDVLQVTVSDADEVCGVLHYADPKQVLCADRDQFLNIDGEEFLGEPVQTLYPGAFFGVIRGSLGAKSGLVLSQAAK